MATAKRLIYADDLELAIRDDLEIRGGQYALMMKHINEAKTVDAAPVVHGRWVNNGICDHKPSRFRNPDKWTIYKCSECGYSNGRRKNANYCPNCGAKMDGRSEGQCL